MIGIATCIALMNDEDDQNRFGEGQDALYERTVGEKENFNEGNSPSDELINEDDGTALSDNAGSNKTHNRGGNEGDGLTYTLVRISKGASCCY